jgi:hypothetical protein
VDGRSGKQATPGILTLRKLIDEHGAEIAADFLDHYHGLDILDLIRGRLSPRRCLALVEQLPLNSRFATAKRGGVQHYGWDRQTYVLADIFDALSSLIYITLMVNSRHPKRVEEPKPYPRPDADKKKQSDKPDILLARLRGEADTPEAGPGKLVPLPPS